MKSKSTLLKVLLVVGLLCLTVLLVTSCGDDSSKKTGGKSDVDYLDDLPDDLDYNGETLNIFHWGSEFVTNELTADGSTGDIVDIAVYNRNLSVEERLNVKLNYIQGELPAEVFMPVVRDEIMSGSTDYDIIVGVQCTSGVVAAAGAFLNLQNAKYIDYSKDYWNSDYIQALSVNEKKFMLGGDISLTTTAWTATMFFDLKPFENTFGDVNEFYNMVLEGDGNQGGWTLDTMADYCRRSYLDVNGNGLADNADRYGTSMQGTSSVIDQYVFSAGIKYSSRDENNIPVLDMKNEKNINFMQKFYSFCWENPGVNLYDSDYSSDAEKIETIFSAGRMDSLVGRRAEEEDFGVIPYPKYDESDTQYHSWLSDCTAIVAVPVTEPEDRVDMATAALECMASEGRRLLLPAYYEIALKDKYTRDETSVKMLDIIHDGSTTDFIAVYSESLNGIGGCMRQLIGYQEPDFVSWYDAKESGVKAKMAKLFKDFDENATGTFVPETTETANSSEAAEQEIGDNQISTTWEVFGSKYRKSQVLVKPDMSEQFAYTVNDDDEIEVRSPSIKICGGYYPTAVIQSRDTLPLVGLSCEFHVDDGFKFEVPEDGYAAAMSVAWSDMPMTALPYYLDGMGTNGLRSCIPAREDDTKTPLGAYSLVVSFMGSKETSGTVADYLYIILFDGTDPIAEVDRRVGYRWTNKVQIDLSQPCTVEVKEDETLGFVVCINGVEYRTGTRGNDTLDIDLSPLKEKMDAGHFIFGGESTGSENYSNFTLTSINGSPAGSFFD